ncbi:hypothetical protein NliqN6_0155 [Naganishia liquefaciens]|uniref:Uncharacterized protein n=1 Tax=Naganishia liquefaciens TaxID=104408 RepID=A0A8H3YC24_9TREE|nr:hypothetical protein NliqN6_0155 [Naganishia liquefaciens]
MRETYSQVTKRKTSVYTNSEPGRAQFAGVGSAKRTTQCGDRTHDLVLVPAMGCETIEVGKTRTTTVLIRLVDAVLTRTLSLEGPSLLVSEVQKGQPNVGIEPTTLSLSPQWVVKPLK